MGIKIQPDSMFNQDNNFILTNESIPLAIKQSDSINTCSQLPTYDQ